MVQMNFSLRFLLKSAKLTKVISLTRSCMVAIYTVFSVVLLFNVVFFCFVFYFLSLQDSCSIRIKTQGLG